MINQGKFRDNSNFLKFAGKTTKLTGDSVKCSMNNDHRKTENVTKIK